MRFSIYVFALCCFFFSKQSIGQEIQAQVRVNAPKLTKADPKVVKSLEKEIRSFINERKWTDDTYENVERIKLNIQLNITEEVSETQFKATLAIQAVRPAFNSNYETVMFSHSDKQVEFTYTGFQQLDFFEDGFSSNLSSVLAFYVYIALGMDYDSYALYGGSDHFQKAQNILNSVPTTIKEVIGWRPLDGSRNRYWVIENILSPRVKPLRKALYSYHLQGLDKMAEDAVTGRNSIAEAVKVAKTVNKDYPNTMIIKLFVDAKRDELIQIFLNADTKQKRAMYDALVSMDASNTSSYRQLLR